MAIAQDLQDVFELLDIPAPAHFGDDGTTESRQEKGEREYKKNSRRVEKRLAEISQSRARQIRSLNLIYFVLIAILVLGVIIQFFTIFIRPGGQLQLSGLSAFISVVQLACTGAIFPLTQRIERNTSIQTKIEFVAVFLAELDPSEAIKAIDQLYQSIIAPENMQSVLEQHTKQ